MKKLLIGSLVFVVLVVAGLYTGETWVSGKVQDSIQNNPDITAEVTPMRQPGRIGLKLQGIEIRNQQQGISLPKLDTYIRMISPATLSIDLPTKMTLRPTGSPAVALDMVHAYAEVSVAPTHAATVDHARISAQDLKADGTPAADSFTLNADLTHMGVGAPIGSAAAYQVDLSSKGIILPSVIEKLSITGKAQVWLNEVIYPKTLFGSLPRPYLTGAQTDGINFTLGKLNAKLIGRVTADIEGFAKGQAAIYTKDGQAFIDTAVAANIISPEIAVPLRVLVNQLTTAAVADDSADTDTRAALLPTETSSIFETSGIQEKTNNYLPPAGPGEIKLPIFMKDGIIRIGPIPIGRAPRIQGN